MEPESDSRANILCILVDDLGYGDLSCMGAADMHTPRIDQMAEQGLLFTRFYANSTVCSPSRASLLTGKYPDLAGVPGVIRQNEQNSWGFLDPEATLIAGPLRKAGYHTAIIGKWHLGYEPPNIPSHRGFDYFKGFLGDMMDDYRTHLRGGINWMRENEQEIDPEGHATDLFTAWAIEYFRERSASSQPFFLYLAYNAPHFPIQPPEDFLEAVREREAGIEEKRAKNVAFIEHLDASVGRVLDGLRQNGLMENTLVFFVSDNGGALRYAQSNGELRGGKQDMYEGGIRVPAIALWKDHIPAGTRTGRIALHMDLYPTFCEIAGTEPGKNIDGISILPTLLGEEQKTDDRTLFWVRREGHVYGGLAYYAARKGSFKLLQNTPYEPLQLFNLDADNKEQAPLTADHEQYSVLKKELREHIRRSGSVPWQNEQ